MVSILVTGGDEDYGFAIATKFAQEGYDVIIAGKNEKQLAAKERELPVVKPKQVHANWPIDLTDPKAHLDIQETVDVFVNNSDVEHLNHIVDNPNENSQEAIEASLHGPIVLAHNVIRKMERAHVKGHVIFFSSAASKKALPDSTIYDFTKASLDAFVKKLQSEVSGKGIQVNAVAPGVGGVQSDVNGNVSSDYADVKLVTDKEKFSPKHPDAVADSIYALVANADNIAA